MKRHIHEEADMKRRSMNTGRRRLLLLSGVYSSISSLQVFASLLLQTDMAKLCRSCSGSGASSSDTRLEMSTEQKWPPSTSVIRHHMVLHQEKKDAQRSDQSTSVMDALERRRASLVVIVADVEPVDLGGVLRRHGQETVNGEQVIVHAVKSRLRG